MKTVSQEQTAEQGKTQHTAGQWMVGVYETTPTMLERLKRPQSCVCIATPGPETGMVVALCGDAEDARSQADANLVAAAPDMLIALKAAYDRSTGWSDDLNSFNSGQPKGSEVERMIRAAIARAEGRPL